MTKLIASIALAAATLGVAGPTARGSFESMQPSPNAVQVWYKTPPTKTKAASSPEASIVSLNLLYGVMVRDCVGAPRQY